MPYVSRKAIYNIEDYSANATSTDWTPAFNAAIAAIKSDCTTKNTTEGVSYDPGAILQLGARVYPLLSPITTIDFPLVVQG